MADSQEKTEQATQKRMKEVRSKGQLSRSQDITAWLGVGAAAVMMPSTLSRAGFENAASASKSASTYSANLSSVGTARR